MTSHRRGAASGGEGAAVWLVARLGASAGIVREHVCRLSMLCQRKTRATEALASCLSCETRSKRQRLAATRES
jgi:hypothetical protein